MIAAASPLLRATALLLAVLVLNSPAAADPLDVSARWVPLDKDDPERKTVDELIWRGGLVLTSSDDRFKELSALLVSGDGLRLTSVTDTGYWVTMNLVYDLAGNLSDVNGGEIGRLRGLDGNPLSMVRDGVLDEDKDWDAESLARLADGSLVVAFERIHRLWRYSPGIDVAATRHPEPSEFDTLTRGSNDGVEALVTLANGELLAIVEGRKTVVTTSDAYLLHDGDWEPLSYPHDEGFRPTGATRLPDGDVLVIERCFKVCNWKTRIRLRRLKKASIVPGARLEGEKIAELKDPLTVDNFEGVAVRHDDERGETLVYLLSDDNGKPIQRTLLLMFALTE